MVFDPACIGHATGGDNDTGLVAIVEKLGLFDTLDIFETFKGKRIIVRLKYLLDLFVEILGIALDDLCSGYAERTVDIIVEGGKTMLYFQLIEGEEYLLRTADAKCRDDELALFLNTGFVDPLQQHIRRSVGRIVQAVAIGRFYQYIVGLGEYFR